MSQRKRAIIVGGSFAGLVAARVLSEFYEEVVLLEKDAFSFSGSPRKGVPQGNHAHAILASGVNLLEKFFPGFREEILGAGAIDMKMGRDTHWFHAGQWKSSTGEAISAPSLSRPLLEKTVGLRVSALPNVKLCGEQEVLSFISNPEKTQLCGVRVRNTEGERELLADLIVDASGRGSHTPVRLEALGYSRPTQEEVTVHVGYATRLYQRLDLGAYKGLIVTPIAPDTKLGILLAIEGDRSIVTLSGWHKDYPPHEEAGFLAFTRQLAMPDIYNGIKDATPLSEIAIHRFPSNLRRHYEKMARWPRGLIVMGDAVCSFNPVYGQGMTISALEAEALQQCLRQGDEGIEQRFQQEIAKIISVPWMLVITEDFRYSQTVGKRPLGLGLLQWYVGRVHERAGDDVVAQAFYQVMNMLKPPQSLFHPRIMRRVLGPA
jgi:2-polyprenyl-6-methoxyphenol hydroxylase-like FAD-dependent oxidoreductase